MMQELARDLFQLIVICGELLILAMIAGCIYKIVLWTFREPTNEERLLSMKQAHEASMKRMEKESRSEL